MNTRSSHVCDPNEAPTCTSSKVRRCLTDGSGYDPKTCANGCRTDGVADCLECASTEHLCNNTCVSKTSAQACGTSCKVCPTVVNAQSACDGTNCSFACDPMTLRCAANGGHDYCQKLAFTFEGIPDTDGWKADTGFTNAAASGALTVSTQRAYAGAQSLAGAFTATPTRNELILGYNPCGRGFASTQPETLDLRSRTLNGQVYLESTDAAATGAKCTVIAQGVACAGCDHTTDVPLGKWTALVTHLGATEASDTTYLGVVCQFDATTSFSGTVWIDQITLQ